MRKTVFALIAAGSALGVAAPAAAQYYPAPPPPAYGHGYGHGDFREVRGLQMRLDAVRAQIDRLDRRDRIRGRAAERLMNEANRIDRRLRYSARGGLGPREAADIQFRIQRLEQQVQWAVQGRWDRVGRW